MSDHYANTHSMYQGQLFIYSLASSVNKTYQVRITIPGRSTPVRRSLKTRILDEAIYLAQDLYLELRARESQGLPLTTISFEDAYKAYVKHRREETSRSNRACDQYLRNYEVYFSQYFGQFTDIGTITSADIGSYWTWRRRYWHSDGGAVRAGTRRRLQHTSKDPAWNTLSKEQTRLRNVFRYAKDQGWIGKVPGVNQPLRKTDSPNRRAGFTPEEYMTLIRAINGRCRRKTKPSQRKKSGGLYKPYYSASNVRGWEAFRAFVLTIANTGIRVQEILQIRWEQIELREDKASGDKYTVIHISKAQSKTGHRRSAVSRDFHKTYDYLMRWKSHALYTDPDDLIFTQDERKARLKRNETTGGKGQSRDFHHMMKTLLRELGLHSKEEDGFTYMRSATSLRHFYCSMRLMEGCPIKPLSDNMGTSYKMIEENYAHLIPWEMRDFLTLHREGYGKQTVQPDEDDLAEEQ